jgi:hypothetical protein
MCIGHTDINVINISCNRKDNSLNHVQYKKFNRNQHHFARFEFASAPCIFLDPHPNLLQFRTLALLMFSFFCIYSGSEALKPESIQNALSLGKVRIPIKTVQIRNNALSFLRLRRPQFKT